MQITSRFYKINKGINSQCSFFATIKKEVCLAAKVIAHRLDDFQALHAKSILIKSPDQNPMTASLEKIR